MLIPDYILLGPTSGGGADRKKKDWAAGELKSAVHSQQRT